MIPFWSSRPRSLHFFPTERHFAPSGDLLVAEKSHVAAYVSRLQNGRARPPGTVYLKRSSLGPQIDEVVAVARAVRDSSPKVVVAFGGARALAATVIGTLLGARSALPSDELDEWLRTRETRDNLYQRLTRASQLPAIYVVPCTLLAAQAVLAETWIINDPLQDSTQYCSHTSLVPDQAWLSIELLEYVRGVNANTAAHYAWNKDIVATVLLESMAFPRPKTYAPKDRASLVAELGRLLTDDNLASWLNLALHSRDLENSAWPIMPALTVSQAIARVTAARPKEAIAGDQAVGVLIGPVMEAFSRILKDSDPLPGVVRAELLEMADAVSGRAIRTWTLSEQEVENVINRALAQHLLAKGLRSHEMRRQAREALGGVLRPLVGA